MEPVFGVQIYKKQNGDLNIVQLDLVERKFRERLGYELDHVVVVHNPINVALVVGAGKNDHFTLGTHQFFQLLKFIKKHKSIHHRHVDIQEYDIREVFRVILILSKVVQGALARILYLHPARKLGYFYNPLTYKIIGVVIIDQHHKINSPHSVIHASLNVP